MTHLVKFAYPETEYTPTFYHCSLPAREILNKAIRNWNSVGGCQFPFQQGKGHERKMTAEETKVLRVIYADSVKGFHPEPSDPDYEEFVANGNQYDDFVFRELAGVGHYWDSENIIFTIFHLVKMTDPTFTFNKIANIGEIELF
jgi:hypothetical protein